MSGAVLLVTNERDIGADLVVAELTRRGVGVVRLNTERLPEWRVQLRPGERWRLCRGLRTASSDETTGVWWRRPEPPAPTSSAASGAEWEAVVAQWRAFATGLASVPGPRWISEPHAISRAEDKATQLAAARALGLAAPETLWTNDVDAAAAHLDHAGGRTVVKSVATAYWEQADLSSFVFARVIETGALPTAGALQAAPVAFQRAVLPKRDVRVTVVGERAFCAACDDAPKSDWRLEEDTTWRPHALPAEETQRCVGLVRELGLRFAGIDLIADADDQYWFLELNPNGEWGWLQQQAELPIAEALVAELTR